jgi:hypothetical protein
MVSLGEQCYNLAKRQYTPIPTIFYIFYLKWLWWPIGFPFEERKKDAQKMKSWVRF